MSSLTPILDSHFNPLILGGFLNGIYLLLFVQALWKLLQKRAHIPYIFALVLLWMSITSSFIISWVMNRSAFVAHNSSPISILTEVDALPFAAGFVPMFVANVVSDSILIWRCHVLWRTTWIVAVLITLLLASSAFNLHFGVDPDGNYSGLAFAGISQILSAATTVCATGMIALKIYIVTRKSRAHYSYSKVIEILVQSAALQSLVMIIDSAAEIGGYILVASNSNNLTLALLFLQIAAYSSSCRLAVMGIAPTLIAFRVAEEKPRTEVDSTSRTGTLSGLAFRHSVRRTDTESEAKRSWISNIRFGSAKGDYSVSGVHFGAGLDDEAKESGRGQSIERGKHITGPDFV